MNGLPQMGSQGGTGLGGVNGPLGGMGPLGTNSIIGTLGGRLGDRAGNLT